MNYQINQYLLDVENYCLTLAGEAIPLEPQAFDLLLLLVQHPGRTVTREEILQRIWQGRLVSDNSINNHIRSVRQALGDDGIRQQVIKTIHSRGYQLIANVRLLEDPPKRQPRSWHSTGWILGLIFALTGVAFMLLQDKQAVEDHPWVVESTPTTEIPKLVVLPFINNKPDPKHDYLGIALASQVIYDLSHQPSLNIQSAAVSRAYANSTLDPISIGQELSAKYLVSGDYLIEQQQIRLNVEVINLPENRVIWQASIDGSLQNTFQLQDQVVNKIATGLGSSVPTMQPLQLHKDIPQNALAYEYFLRGIAYPYSNDGHQLAIAMLQKSIELDPQFAPAYAHIGSHRRLLEQHGRVLPAGLKKAEWYYLKALETNPRQLIALSNLATLYTETNRTEEAVAVIRKMLAINPNDASSHFALGYVFRYAGLLEQSAQHMEKALKISPGNPRFRSIIATYVSAGKYTQAAGHINPNMGEYGMGYQGIMAFDQQDYDLARMHFNRLIQMNENDIWGLISQTYLAIMDGDKTAGLKALRTMMKSDIQDAENTYYYADFLALLGEQEACLEQLELAVDSGYFNYPYMSRNKAFHWLQDNPKFQSIMTKAKIRHDEFKSRFSQ